MTELEALKQEVKTWIQNHAERLIELKQLRAERDTFKHEFAKKDFAICEQLKNLNLLQQENVLLRRACQSYVKFSNFRFGKTSFASVLDQVPLTAKAQRISELEKKVVEAAKHFDSAYNERHQAELMRQNLSLCLVNLNAAETV